MHPSLHAARREGLNLVFTDAGRPITNIKPNIDFPGLKKFIMETIGQLRTQQVEVQDNEGRWFRCAHHGKQDRRSRAGARRCGRGQA